MFDLLVLLSRYAFIALIGLFIFFGLIFVIDERKGEGKRLPMVISAQHKIIVVMHIIAYAILSWNETDKIIDVQTIVIGVLVLVYFYVANKLIKKSYKRSCPFIWNCMYFLMDISMIMLQRLNHSLASKQLVWLTASMVIMLLIPLILKLIPKLEKFEIFYFVAAIVFILLTFVSGNELYGSLNWISIGGIGFQPSEIVKFLFLLYIACVFRKPLDMKKLGIITGFAAFIVICLVLQKDLGGALIFFTTYMLLLYITTSNILLLLGGVGCMGLASAVAYKLFSHVRVRVKTWLDPWSDAGNTGYQITQSLFAITTWGFLGSGLTRGMPTKIPVVERDMIFSAICEEFGCIFAMGLVCIYVLMFIRGMLIAVRSKRRFYSILSAGIVIMFSFQTFIIIGGVIKLIPLTGVTLPFVSYGGSSILVSSILMGLLQWSNQMSLLKDKNGDEHDNTAELDTYYVLNNGNGKISLSKKNSEKHYAKTTVAKSSPSADRPTVKKVSAANKTKRLMYRRDKRDK